MFSLWSICMSLRLKASLCLPQGILKSTTGVCWPVFLPSIQTSDQGTELTVMVQSPPRSPLGLLSSSALAAAPAPSPPSSSPTSCAFLCRGTCGAEGDGGATSASCVCCDGLGDGLGSVWWGAAGGGGGGATAASGRDGVFPDPVAAADPEAGINMAWTF